MSCETEIKISIEDNSENVLINTSEEAQVIVETTEEIQNINVNIQETNQDVNVIVEELEEITVIKVYDEVVISENINIRDTEINLTPNLYGQTLFNISPLPRYPNLAELFINGVFYPYGQFYTFMTTGQLVWLNNLFQLNTNMQLTIKYYRQ